MIMTYFLSDYTLSTCDRLYMAGSMGALSGLPYAAKHWEKADTHWLHYVIAFIEALPFLGGLAALVEYVAHTFFSEKLSPINQDPQLLNEVDDSDKAPETAVDARPESWLNFLKTSSITEAGSMSRCYLTFTETSNSEGNLFAIFQTRTEQFSKRLSKEKFSTEFTQAIQTSNFNEVSNRLIKKYMDDASEQGADATVCLCYFDKRNNTVSRTACSSTTTFQSLDNSLKDQFHATLFSKQAETSYEIQPLNPGDSLPFKVGDYLFVYPALLQKNFENESIPEKVSTEISTRSCPYYKLEAMLPPASPTKGIAQ